MGAYYFKKNFINIKHHFLEVIQPKKNQRTFRLSRHLMWICFISILPYNFLNANGDSTLIVPNSTIDFYPQTVSGNNSCNVSLDRAEFTDSLNRNTNSTIIDDNNNFAPDPANAGGLAVINRSGTIGTTPFAYDIYDIDFSNSPTGIIMPGIQGNDINQLNNIDIESPVRQGGATGTGSWGFDTNSGQNSTRNALLFDFTSTPNNLSLIHI